ncbi:MAG: InlB B-repeat-containing protein [Saccharofermentanales bacterium]|jgi:uncharacterized repeat protein (TIGR02543 family)
MRTKSKWIALALVVVMGVGLLSSVSLADPPAVECSTWAEVQAAFDDARDVKLMADITGVAGEQPLHLADTSPKQTTLDLNGHTLSAGSIVPEDSVDKTYVIAVYNAVFTIMDSSSPSTGKITGGDIGVGLFSSVFNLKGGTITGNNDAGVSIMCGSVVMEGGVISDNKGSGIYSHSNKITMDGGTITGNRGGGIFSADSDIVMKSGSIEGNASDGEGGGVTLYSSNMIMHGGTIANNSSDVGGGIWVSRGNEDASLSKLTIYGGSITGNTARKGGGIGISDGELVLEGGSVTDNTATEEGGGISVIYVDSDYDCVNVSGSAVVSGNKNTSTNKTENIYLNDEQAIKIVGALSASAKLGVTANPAPNDTTPVVVAKGASLEKDADPYTPTDSDRKKFFSDEGYGVRLNDKNEIELYGDTNEQVTVTFDADGGAPVPEKQHMNKGEKAVQPDNPSKASFDFGGWYSGDSKWDFGNPVNANLNLKAQWTPKPVPTEPTTTTPVTTEPEPTPVTTAPEPTPAPTTTDPSQQALDVEIPAALNEGNDIDAAGDIVVYHQGTSTGAAFRVIGAEVADFERVEVEGDEISTDNYTVESGSIIVKLKQAYLNSLPVGMYKVSIVTTKGTGVKNLDIKAPTPTTTTEAKKPVTPATGEARFTQFWWLALLLLVVGAVLLLSSVYRRRRESR